MKMHVKKVLRSEGRLEGRGVVGGRNVFRFVWACLLKSCSSMAEQPQRLRDAARGKYPFRGVACVGHGATRPTLEKAEAGRGKLDG